MGYFVGIPLGGATEKDYQVRFGKNMTFQVETRAPHLPAEWALQSGVQLTWPHANTDWAYMLEEVQQCFIAIASEIAKRELLLIVTPEPEEVRMQISAAVNMDNVRFLECETNDTWARDHGAITMVDTEGASLLDFTFNGWGLKFASDKDNQITRRAVEAEILKGRYMNRLGFVLEGGSIHSDGEGTLLVTEACLLSPGRNPHLTKEEIEKKLCEYLGAKKVIWLKNGIWQDETNEHVDNVCAFVKPGEVVLAWTDDKEDPQYALSMEDYQILENETDAKGRKFVIHKLPIPEKPVCIQEEDLKGLAFEPGEDTREAGERLAASYVNFYIANEAVLVPQFQDKHDKLACDILGKLFPERKICPIDAQAIIIGGGNIHCITQQIPSGCGK